MHILKGEFIKWKQKELFVFDQVDFFLRSMGLKRLYSLQNN